MACVRIGDETNGAYPNIQDESVQDDTSLLLSTAPTLLILTSYISSLPQTHLVVVDTYAATIDSKNHTSHMSSKLRHILQL